MRVLLFIIYCGGALGTNPVVDEKPDSISYDPLCDQQSGLSWGNMLCSAVSMVTQNRVVNYAQAWNPLAPYAQVPLPMVLGYAAGRLLEACGELVQALLRGFGLYTRLDPMTIGFWVMAGVIVMIFIYNKYGGPKSTEKEQLTGARCPAPAQQTQQQQALNQANQQPNVAPPSSETGGTAATVKIESEHSELLMLLKDQLKAANMRIETLEAERTIKVRTIERREQLLRRLGVRNFTTGQIDPSSAQFSVRDWNGCSGSQAAAEMAK